MIYKHDITGFNEFWLDCDTEMMFSLLVSYNSLYKNIAYQNDYHYSIVRSQTPHDIYFNEVRLIPDISYLREKTFKILAQITNSDTENNLTLIKKSLIEGHYVMIGVDLFEWVRENMCYHNLHVEHYTLLNGYNDEKNTFYTMETDNEMYREFEVSESMLIGAMEMMETLKYQVVVFDFLPQLIEDKLFNLSHVRKNAKKIIKSIKPLLKQKFWIFSPEDYKGMFYRDMTVMYLLQINCRAKANRLLFRYLCKKEKISQEYNIEAKELEKGWIGVHHSISKLYFKKDAVEQMYQQNNKIHCLFLKELNLWKRFLRDSK